MNVSSINTYTGLTGGDSAIQAATQNADKARFSELLDKLRAANGSENTAKEGNPEKSTLSSSEVLRNGRLNGEWTTGFYGAWTSENDKNSAPRGAAANQANSHVQSKNIDRTSELYEKAQELENYFVKQMLSQMRKTVVKAQDADFATNMYEDMLWDEYSQAMTKNAGFGLADQIYLQLS